MKGVSVDVDARRVASKGCFGGGCGGALAAPSPKYSAGPGESGMNTVQSVRAPVEPKLKPPVAYVFFTGAGLTTDNATQAHEIHQRGNRAIDTTTGSNRHRQAKHCEASSQ